MSSQYGGGKASRCIDGDTGGQNSGTCHTHTGTNAWLAVQLVSRSIVDSVAVWNRNSHMNRLGFYEIYVGEIFQSDLYGFLEVEEFLFGERAQVVVDPSEEKLKNQFAGVHRSFIPVNAIIRIDEVEKEGVGKITEAGSNVTAFPLPFGPGGKK